MKRGKVFLFSMAFVFLFTFLTLVSAIPSANLYTASGNNYSTENILLNYSSDGNSYTVNTTDWRQNGVSFSPVYYSFDEGLTSNNSIVHNYAVGSLYNGTILINTSSVNGFIGKTFDLSSSNSSVIIPHSQYMSTNQSNMTIAFWVKLNPYVSIGGLMQKGSTSVGATDFTIWRNSGGLAFYKGNGTSYDSGNQVLSIPDNQWVFASFTWNNNTRTMIRYLNGTEQSRYTISDPTFTFGNAGNLTINAKIVSWFNGSIDELRFFDRVVPATELLKIYNVEKNGNRNSFPTAYLNPTDNISASVTINNGGADLFTTLTSNLTVNYYGASFLWAYLNTTTNLFYSAENLFATWLGNSMADKVSVDYLKNNISDEKLHMSFDQNITIAGSSILDLSYPQSTATVGTLNATWNGSNCVVGGCYNFNNDSYLSVADSSEVDCINNCTIMFWYKLNSIGASQGILGKGTSWSTLNYNFWAVGGNSIRFYYSSNGGANYDNPEIVTYPTDATLGVWTHLTMVKNGTVANFYLNGQLLKTLNMGSNFTNWNNNAGALTIGGYDTNAGKWNGSIDELHMWDRPLTQADISYYYTTELSGVPAGLPSSSMQTGENWSARLFAFSDSVPSSYLPQWSTILTSSHEMQQSPPSSVASIQIMNQTLALYNSDLLGKCTATDFEGSNVNYQWIWYKNGVQFSTGTLLNQTSGVEVSLNQINASQTSQNEDWTFSCRANDSLLYGNWNNYSLVLRDPVQLYVATTGNDTTGDGSIGSPWKTINYAIQHSLYGDNVSVANGTYSEKVFNLNKTVNLVAQHKNGAILNVTDLNDSVVRLSSSFSSIDGFKIDCRNSSINLYGIFLDADNVQAKNNLLSNCSVGVKYNTNKELDKVLIDGNYFTDLNANIESFVCDGSTISNNMFNMTKNVNYGLEYTEGGSCDSSKNLLIESNLFFNSPSAIVTTASFNKLGLTDLGQNITFRNNTIGSIAQPFNALFGVYAQYPHNLWLVNNTFIMNNTGRSISAIETLNGGSEFHVINNTIGSLSYLWGSASFKPSVNPLDVTYVDNVEVRGNKLYLANFTAGLSVAFSNVNPLLNPTIDSNYVYATINTNSYMIQVGTEGISDRHTIILNATVTNNVVDSKPYTSGDTPNHGIFIGYTNNTYLANNRVNGGLYTYVLKGNTNLTNINNSAFGSRMGMYDKASINGFWSNGVFNGSNVTDYCILITQNVAYNHSSINNVHHDMLFYQGGQPYDYMISSADNVPVNVTIINATRWNGTASIPAVIRTDYNYSTALIGWWYDLTVYDYLGNVVPNLTAKSIRSDNLTIQTNTTNVNGKVRLETHEKVKGNSNAVIQSFNNSFQLVKGNKTVDIEAHNITFNLVDTFNLTAEQTCDFEGKVLYNNSCYDSLATACSSNGKVVNASDCIAPSLSIVSPTNSNYDSLSILVNISSNGNNTWFTNSSGANETYTVPVYRTFSEGSNTLNVYTNYTLGNLTQSNVTFTIVLPIAESLTSSGSYSVPVSTTSLQSGATQSLFFGMKLIVPYKTENHTISLNKINRTNSEVLIDIYSEKQTISLKLNESKEIDLNKDSVADLKVTLLKVYDNLVKVDLKIELLNNAVKEENKTSVGETIKNVVSEVKEKSYSLWITLVILLVLIGTVFVLWKKKFSHDYRFRLLVNKIKYSSKH